MTTLSLRLIFCLVAVALPSLAVADLPKPPLATELKGLALYLPFDEAGEIADTVSKRKPTVANGVSRIEGMRGQGVRLAHPGGDSTPLIDLYSFRQLLSRPLGRGFTLAAWVRPGTGNAMAFLANASGYDVGVPLFWFQTEGKLAQHVFAHNTFRQARVATPLQAPAEKGGWMHFALTWDGRDQVVAYRDGQPDKWVAEPREGERHDLSWLPLNEFGLGVLTRYTGLAAGSVDLDEFCVFSRALDAAEVKALAGRGAVPSQANVTPDPVLGPSLTPRESPRTYPVEGAVRWKRSAAVWPFADAVFDPGRKMLWTVGSDRFGEPVERGVLRRYSYPGFEPKGAYLLPGAPYKVAIDSRRGRVAVAFNVTDKILGPGPAWALWHGSHGPIHLYEFDDLPYNPAAPPPLKPWRVIVEDADVIDMAFAPDGSGLFVRSGKLDPKTNACLHRYGVGGVKPSVLAIPDARGNRLGVRTGGKGLLCFGTLLKDQGAGKPANWSLVQIDSAGKVTLAGEILLAGSNGGYADLALEGDDVIWAYGPKGVTRYKRPGPGESAWVAEGSFTIEIPSSVYYYRVPQQSKVVVGWEDRLRGDTYIRTAEFTDPQAKLVGPYQDAKDGTQRGYAWPTPDGKYLLYRNGGVYELPK